MNVASLELCEELYELSGWKDTPNAWRQLKYVDDEEPDADFLPDPPRVGHNELASLGIDRFLAPAYGLGYLLRKLPNQVGSGYYLSIERNFEQWVIGYQAYGEFVQFEQYADTPEDAAAMLAIELFKQGILTKGDK